MRILIVEDEKEIREIISEISKDFSKETFEAKNGLEGWTLLKQAPFDLLVSDYQMPKMSGLDLLQICKTESVRIPTIWLSGRDNPELREYAWQYGLYDYIEKPFDIEDFRASVMELKELDPAIRKEFFEDFHCRFFSIPYAVVSKTLEKATLRELFTYCKKNGIAPSELVTKMLAET